MPIHLQVTQKTVNRYFSADSTEDGWEVGDDDVTEEDLQEAESELTGVKGSQVTTPITWKEVP